jgi:hypothetical protein
MFALSTYEAGAAEPTDRMRPPTWSGNFWGPAATRARLAGELPPLPTDPQMARWRHWGQRMLREGDIVFRLGDARTARGTLPLSHFIARATGSPFSHTGIVAIEDHSTVIYDCSAGGIQRAPFEVWMLDCAGAVGVKRLKPEHRSHIPGVIGFCRTIFERQVPFDYEFRLGDDAYYCVELTEKAFRSQGLPLSKPIRIGDWQHLNRYPLTAFAIPYATGLILERPITLEQTVYVPGNEHQGVWASPLLETVFGPEPKPKAKQESVRGQAGGLSLQGDIELAIFAADELRQSYTELPIRWLGDLAMQPQMRELFADRSRGVQRATLSD